MKSTALLLVLAAAGKGCESPHPIKPPKNDDLPYKQESPMQREDLTGFFSAFVDGTRAYRTPEPGKDCNHFLDLSWQFKLEDAADEIRVRIADYDGISPGTGFAYNLYQLDSNNQGKQKPWLLIMEQAPDATVRLYQVTWIFRKNAIVVNPELGHGRTAEFQRPFEDVTIRGTYRLSPDLPKAYRLIDPSITVLAVKKGLTLCD